MRSILDLLRCVESIPSVDAVVRGRASFLRDRLSGRGSFHGMFGEVFGGWPR